MEQISGFPKNLAYNLKRLQGSIIKQKIVINADKTTVNPNDRVLFNFPIGRMIDSRSIVLSAKAISGTTNYFPRGGLNSLIENLQISANSKIIQSTQAYNYIWNILADTSGYFSAEQAPKRIYENYDPSMAHTNVDGSNAPALTLKTRGTTGTETYYLCVNNWLGFLSSSASTWDTNNLGQVQLTLTISDSIVQWKGATGSAAAEVATSAFKLEELMLSMDTVTFTNSLYYDLVKSQLEGAGLNIAYNDYLVATSTTQTKSATATITTTAQFSTNSLDLLIATFRNKNYATPTVLLLGDAIITAGGVVGSSITYSKMINDPTATASITYGGFNNSIYFQRAGGGIKTSSWYINSQPFTVNSSPIQIFNNTLQALDYTNIDIASGGLHPGALSTGHYNRNYFVDCLSLENISGDGNNWVSGLGGNGGVISVQYNATFTAASQEADVIPYIIGRVSKIMNIKIGRNIDIME
jgi:hypothetical protein